LVRRLGSYDKITPEAWAEHERAMAEWQERRRTRLEGGQLGIFPVVQLGIFPIRIAQIPGRSASAACRAL
jgi:hypothetical protein